MCHVNVSYQGTAVFHDLSLDFPTSKTTVLLGASGSGKSTILKTLLGLLKPVHGKIQIRHPDLNYHNLTLLRQNIGYMVQGSGLFPHLSLADNVSLLPRYLKWEQEKIKTRLGELADLVQLERDILTRYPRQVSGGQKQRASLMRALMLDPPLMMLDEPLGALDPMTRFDLQQDLKKIFLSLKKTVIFVTHDLAEAAYFADKICLLYEGKVLQQGSFHDLLHHPADPYVTKFVTAQRFYQEGD
ncbi:MAG: ATP-binding cassette domain-containing protein [Oligoflexus sp.]